MALFEKKEPISRKEFRDVLRKKNPVVPGTGRKMFGLPERIEMEKKLFGKRPETQASKEKYKRLVREIGKEKYKISDVSKRQIIGKKIRFLKRLGGI